MNKQKTYTVLRDKIDTYGQAVVKITLRFVRNEISEEDRDNLWKTEGYKLLEAITQPPNYDEGQEESVEEIKQFIIITSGNNLIAPSTIQMAKKFNELICSHNNLLKQMKGRQV